MNWVSLYLESGRATQLVSGGITNSNTTHHKGNGPGLAWPIPFIQVRSVLRLSYHGVYYIEGAPGDIDSPDVQIFSKEAFQDFERLLDQVVGGYSKTMSLI